MKTMKRVLFIVLLAVIVLSLVACGGGDKGSNNNKGNDDNGGGQTITDPTTNRPVSTMTASSIRALDDLEDYGSSQAKYAKQAVTFSGNTYAGQPASAQMEKLQARIDQKDADVRSEDESTRSDSSFIKIFAMSTPAGLLQRMADAALTYEEMTRVVDYLYGSEENPNIGEYIYKKDNGSWDGKLTDGKTEWRSLPSTDGTGYFNKGWSFFDDWELYDRLKQFTEDASKGSDKDLAGDNAAWQYRSILQKVYTEVKLDGDAAARLATYMLDYAIKIVEDKSRGNIGDAITVSAGGVTYGAFATYCKSAPSASDPYSGLQDYETLSYLLAFNEYYTSGTGLKDCVQLYGYYYNYNKTYYFESLADEATYAKQLKYEKQETFTDDEWWDYVTIQRNNYLKAYRYSESFYDKFYTVHFGFQGIIEKQDANVYKMAAVRTEYNLANPGTTYTKEMQTATTKTGSINGIAGQLALSDWTLCYSDSRQCMDLYNQANTKRVNGKNSGRKEEEYEGKFNFEMEQLYFVNYLLTKMSANELSGALYYQVYAYSASMVGNMQNDIKDVVYTADGVEEGSHYTNIDPAANNANQYAIEKINVIYGQTFTSWNSANVKNLGDQAGNQEWDTMNSEILAAIKYDYNGMQIENKSEQWKERCERLEDLVVVRIWSCCNQKVHEASTADCPTSHSYNPKDGSPATKEYDTEHKISLFVSNYEDVLYHMAGKATVSFAKASVGYETNTVDNSKTWTAGYDNKNASASSIANLRKIAEKSMAWDTRNPKKEITVSAGKKFVDEIAEADSDDSGWWNENKTKGTDVAFDSNTQKIGEQTYTYTYTFKGWYLDENCLYAFNENDDIDVNLNIYAGYDVEKKRSTK